MDWPTEHLYLKVTLPLSYMLVTSTTEGVGILCRSIKCANPIEINTPCVKGLW